MTVYQKAKKRPTCLNDHLSTNALRLTFQREASFWGPNPNPNLMLEKIIHKEGNRVTLTSTADGEKPFVYTIEL